MTARGDVRSLHVVLPIGCSFIARMLLAASPSLLGRERTVAIEKDENEVFGTPPSLAKRHLSHFM